MKKALTKQHLQESLKQDDKPKKVMGRPKKFTIQLDSTQKTPADYAVKLELPKNKEPVIADEPSKINVESVLKYNNKIILEQLSKLPQSPVIEQIARSTENLIRKVDNTVTREDFVRNLKSENSTIKDDMIRRFDNMPSHLMHDIAKLVNEIQKSVESSINNGNRICLEKIESKFRELLNGVDHSHRTLVDIREAIAQIKKDMNKEAIQPIVSDYYLVAGLGLILVFLGTFTHNNVVLSLGSGFFIFYAVCVALLNKIWSK